MGRIYNQIPEKGDSVQLPPFLMVGGVKKLSRLFVDMDGTLATFRKVSAPEELYEPGYFANLPPQKNVVNAVKLLICTAPTIEVFILSSVLFDSRYAMEEKNAWLDRYLPELDEGHRVFLPCGESKASYVPGKMRESDCLLDDYTKNLGDWNRAGGRGIKLLNGINHTRGSWSGERIDFNRPTAELANALLEIAAGRCLQNEQPRRDMRSVDLELHYMALANLQRCTQPGSEQEL